VRDVPKTVSEIGVAGDKQGLIETGNVCCTNNNGKIPEAESDTAFEGWQVYSDTLRNFIGCKLIGEKFGYV